MARKKKQEERHSMKLSEFIECLQQALSWGDGEVFIRGENGVKLYPHIFTKTIEERLKYTHEIYASDSYK